MYFHEFHGMISITIYCVKRLDRRKSRTDHSRELHCDDFNKRCNKRCNKTLRNAGINPDNYCKVDNDNN